MHKHLYFVCPSDNLEGLIDKKFPQENYFLSSLGNSLSLSKDIMQEVSALIELKGIDKITFILSDDNKLIFDGLRNQNFDNINVLKKLYNNISNYKKLTSKVYGEENIQILVTSNLLNEKIKEIKLSLCDWLSSKVNIDAKIYFRKSDEFKGFPNDLFDPRNLHLN